MAKIRSASNEVHESENVPIRTCTKKPNQDRRKRHKIYVKWITK